MQAQLYARGRAGSAEFAPVEAGHDQPAWARTTHSLPTLREHSVVPDCGGGGGGNLNGSPHMDFRTNSAGIHPAKVPT